METSLPTPMTARVYDLIFIQSHASPSVLRTHGSDQRRPGVASHAREPSKNSVPSHWSQSQVTTTKLAGGLEHILLMGYNNGIIP